MLFIRDDRGHSGQLTEATQGTDSESEPQNSANDTPVLEAAASSVVPLEGASSPTPPLRAEGAPLASQQETPKPFIPASDSFINSLVSDRDKLPTPQPSVTEEEGEEPSAALIVATPEGHVGHDVPWMNVDLEGAEAARGMQAAGPSVDGATYTLGSLETSHGAGEEDGPVWAWVSGGGCDVDANSQIGWLSPTGTRPSCVPHIKIIDNCKRSR